MMSGDEEDGCMAEYSFEILCRTDKSVLDQGRQHQLEGPEDHEDILHPLREAANRVGREVEKFAEVLDGYNPLRVDDMEDRHARTVDLIDKYYTIAKDTSSRLREQHQAERRKKDGKAWRKKMWGMKIAQDTDEFDSDESDSEHLPQRSGQTTVRDMERWEQEAQTWNLLARLVQLRYPQPGTVRGNNTDKPVNQYSTEKELWSNFLATDEIAVERKTVLEWLKSTAEESGEDIDDLVQELQHNANRGDMIAAGWLHTKMAIKGVKRSIGAQESIDSASSAMKNASRTELLVTQLDPDAVSRQGRRLEAEDQYFERAVWLGCYAMLRRGRSLDDIREWCIERSQVWRAVSMAGLPDGQSEEDNGEGIDPQSWPLWRRMCYALAHNEEGDDYERAVYGILSGDIASVEPVCRSLDDFLFANYNALLRTQFDQYLQTIYSSGSVPAAVGAFGISDAVQQHGEPRSAGKRLIELLTNDPRTKTEMLQPMKMLQGVLIANDFQSFIHQQGLALSKFANATSRSNLIPAETIEPENLEKYIDDQDHDSLRVFTHVLLVFMSLDVNLGGIWKRTAVENVIVSYVTFLRLSGKEELIPLYCSQLSGTRRYAALARSLIDITDQEQRVTQIRLIRELGLDVQEFVRKQSQFLFQDFSDSVNDYPATKSFKLLRNGEDGRREIIPDFFGEEVEIDRPDLLLIRSLEWYLLIDGLWSETFLIGTLLHSRFFSKTLILHLQDNN
jgi:nuclear pore complex protein Nup107